MEDKIIQIKKYSSTYTYNITKLNPVKYQYTYFYFLITKWYYITIQNNLNFTELLPITKKLY